MGLLDSRCFTWNTSSTIAESGTGMSSNAGEPCCERHATQCQRSFVRSVTPMENNHGGCWTRYLRAGASLPSASRLRRQPGGVSLCPAVELSARRVRDGHRWCFRRASWTSRRVLLMAVASLLVRGRVVRCERCEGYPHCAMEPAAPLPVVAACATPPAPSSSPDTRILRWQLLEPGAWSLEPGAWGLEPGAWSLEPATTAYYGSSWRRCGRGRRCGSCRRRLRL